MIQIDAIEKKKVKVEISEETLFKEVESRIRFKYGIRQNQWLDNGKLYHEEHTSHAWDSCDGDATPEQIAAFEAIALLRKTLLEE